MSAADQPLELIEQARAALGQVREMLLAPTPTSLDRCARPLAEATDRLQRLKSYLEAQGDAQNLLPDARGQPWKPLARELQREVSDLRKLLGQAGAFYLGWARILLSASGSYTANGAMTAPADSGTLRMEG